LSPLKWEHILIPLIPDKYLGLLEAPVPCIIGRQASIKQGEDITQSMIPHEVLIVLLDSGKIIDCIPEGKCRSLQRLPNLANLKKSIENEYKMINKGKEVKAAADKILAIMESCLRKSILNYLPILLPLKEANEIDLVRIKEMIKEKVKPIDEEFVDLFCETQMFASYVEDLHAQIQARIAVK